jgi:uncharacterized protein YheU (UPF0270 family)
MTKYLEVEIVPEDDAPRARVPEHLEEGVEVPLDRIDPAALRNLIAEFVTREWEELGDSPSTLEERVGQVQRQLQDRKAKVVFDLRSNSCNIVPVP